MMAISSLFSCCFRFFFWWFNLFFPIDGYRAVSLQLSLSHFIFQRWQISIPLAEICNIGCPLVAFAHLLIEPADAEEILARDTVIVPPTPLDAHVNITLINLDGPLRIVF